jgi:AAA15 family ATPase/GTPase
MKLINLRIKNFRTISTEQSIDLTNGLTIVGPNSSGKTNILKSIQMIFTGYENKFDYSIKHDLTFDTSKVQTSLVATFVYEEILDDDFFGLYQELNQMLEQPKELNNQILLYLSFATSTGTPTYRFFSNEKMKKELQAQFSRKQIQAVNILLGKFVCHYVPSSKSIDELYTSLLLPFIKRSVTNVLLDKVEAINNSLAEISNHLDQQLKLAGLPHITSHFSLPNNSIEHLIDKFEFHLSDPNKTEIYRKGMGIQASAVLASFLWITKEEKTLKKNTIWLIEEPESYLHPQLADACHKMLNQLTQESLLVTTTHSLGFVNQDPTKVVGTTIESEHTKITKYNTYIEATHSLRNALGVKFSDYYNLSEFNLFVEGKSDREIFKWFLSKLKEQDGKYLWENTRKAEILDFSGVSGLEGFLKATYSFIRKERPVVVVFDGDDAGESARRNLQGYFGQKQIPFDANKHFISLHSGFSLEGLFPHDWIIDAHAEHPDWFKSYSVDVANQLQTFEIKTTTNKEQLRNRLIAKAETEESNDWATKFIQVFEATEIALTTLKKNIYDSKI